MSDSSIWAIGLMSGTSLDGIDAALVRTDGVQVHELGAWIMSDYPPALREQLREVVHGQGNKVQAEREMTLQHAKVVQQLLKQAGMQPQDVGVIGFHGQTVDHRPEEGITVQIGDGALLAAETGIDVIYDMRKNDVREGGQGAPLVPLFHAALAKNLSLPVAMLNIGGIANVTYIGRDANGVDGLRIIAFDTGPGNVLMNDYMHKMQGKSMDAGGELAAQGEVKHAVIDAYLQDPYFQQKAPKSLDRNYFNMQRVFTLEDADALATLTAFTAASIEKALEHFPKEPTRWLVSGGGRLNMTLMNMLKQRLGNVLTVEANGWDGDAIEAQAFAYLAVRSLNGYPLTLPETTGVRQAVTGGVFCPGASAAAL